MNAIEERLRAATTAAAATVPGDTVPPLQLPARRGHLPVLPGLWRRAAAPRVIAPAAAAAAVVALVVASLVITGGSAALRPGSRTGAGGKAGTGGTEPAMLSAADEVALASVPPYYAALPFYADGPRNDVVIRATATGALLASVQPPAPYGTFSWVSAAADDRTFVVAAQPWVNTARQGVDSAEEPTAFFRLRFSPATRRAQLTRLPIQGEPASSDVSGISVSPDGSKLAVAVSPWSAPRQGANSQPQNPSIQVFSLATGAGKQWSYQGPGWIGLDKPLGQPLAWAADSRTLAFEQYAGSSAQDVDIRVLDTAAPGGHLQQSSRLVRSFPNAAITSGACGNIFLAADGTRIVCAVYDQAANGRPQESVSEFSVDTGQVVATLGPSALVTEATQSYVGGVLWASPAGDRVILVGGILTGAHLTPLPGIGQDPYELAW